MRFVLFCIALCTGLLLQAQFSFQPYTPVNGLVDARVRNIYQDTRGVLYFLTWDGLSSFDGQRFENFNTIGNQPVSVTNNMVQLADGRLLVSAISGIYLFKDNHFSRDSTFSKAVLEPGNFLPLQNGQFLLPASSGLFLWNGLTMRQLDSKAINNANGRLSLEAAAASGNFMAAVINGGPSGNRLLLYNWQTQQVADKLDKTAFDNLVSYHDSVFVRTDKGWQQLDAAAWQQGKLAPRPLYFSQWVPMGFSFSNFYIDPSHHIWLMGNDQSLCRISPGMGSPVFYNKADGLPTGIVNMFCDAEGNAWLMAHGKGVYKMVRGRVAPFAGGKLQKGLFLSEGPEGLVLGKKDTLWQITRESQQSVNMRTPQGSLQAFYWNGEMWHLLQEGVLVSAGGRRIALDRVVEGAYPISSRISFDRDNRLLVAGTYCNIIDKNYRQWSIKLPYFTDRMVVDDNNNYWCFARSGDILRYRLEAGNIVKIAAYNDKNYSPRDVLYWGGDTFCIGTRNLGLVLAKAGNGGYRYISAVGKNRGLSNDFITGMQKTGTNTLLTATPTGLDLLHFYPGDTTVEQLYGRINVFTGVRQLARLNDSTVLALNDDNTLNQVDLRPGSRTGFVPRLFWNQIKANGQVVDTLQAAAFAYNQNNLHFSVSAPSFIDEKNIRFRFLLTGGERDMEQQGLLPGFDMTNLPPGNYRLQVTANVPGYQFVMQPLEYRFTIAKPFWQTIGFIAGMAALLLLSAFAIFRGVLRRRLQQQRIQLEKEKAVASERTRIATDMHDDLGAGISTIKYLSQSAPFIAPAVQKENNLKIAAQADELVDKMNDIIWAMNENNDTLDNLLYYCKAWVVEYCDAHHLQAAVLIPDAIPQYTVRGDIRQHIFLCIKEAVHNIVKHAGATAMQLKFSHSDGKLDIVISDNGRGYDRQKIKPGNGLYNMQKRMQQLKGSLKTENTNGTSLHFLVPL
jgi:signal transduction histidine kinase